MKNLKFVIILFLLVVILFSLFKYVSDEEIIENMSDEKINEISDIVNDNPPSSDDQKITALKKFKVIQYILDNTSKSNLAKFNEIKKFLAGEKAINDWKAEKNKK